MPRWPAKSDAKPIRPTHQSELCPLCGQNPITADHTNFVCEHGSWNMADYAPLDWDPEPVPVESVEPESVVEPAE